MTKKSNTGLGYGKLLICTAVINLIAASVELVDVVIKVFSYARSNTKL
jgi:hypothetical protein